MTENAESNLEELQAEMSLFWGVHAPHQPLDLPPVLAVPPPPPPLPPYHPTGLPFYLPPHPPPFDMESRSNVRRTRVCKRCKFSTTDAREFLHHQIKEHSESVEVHQCDKCDFVTAVYTELVSHRRIHRRSSARRSSADSDSGLIDDANNNEKQDDLPADDSPSSPALNANSDLQIGDAPSPSTPSATPESAPSKECIASRNYTCSECGFKSMSSKDFLHHLKDVHQEEIEIHECDLCDYATRYKHKLPRHRECHFNTSTKASPKENAKEEVPSPTADPEKDRVDRDENANQTKTEMPVPALNESRNRYAALTQRLNSHLQLPKVTDVKTPVHMSGGQLLATSNKSLASFISPKGRQTGMNSSPTQVPMKTKPACTPVREAVDPAKYVTIREPDGVKYACSKCGNIYKWRKSLNKHWKEKHDGEIPDPRPSFTPLTIPRIQGKEAGGKGKHMTLAPPADLMVPFSGQSLLANMATNARPLKSQAYRSPMLSQALKKPPMLGANLTPEDVSSRFLHLQQIGGRGSPDVQHVNGDGRLTERDILSGGHRGFGIYGDMKPRTLPSRPIPKRGASPFAESENILDLSKKPCVPPIPSMIEAVEVNENAEPLQDEPLDLSKRSVDEEKRDSPPPPRGISMMQAKDFNFNKYGFYDSPVPEQTGSLSLQCPSCAYIGRDKQDYDNHMELHLRKRHYKCAECQQVFFTIEDLNDHFLELHVEILQSKATLAGKSYGGGSNESTQLFKYLTMDSSKQLFSCVVCGAIFQWQWTLAKHFHQDHPTLPNPYRKRAAPSASEAEGKRRDTEASEPRRLHLKGACKLCDYETHQKEDLLLHYKNAHPSASLDISQLMAAEEDLGQFSGNGDITAENTAIVIPQAPEETARISPPSKRSRGPRTISANANESAENLLPFKCSVCEYRARWPSEITQHMKNHSDEKPYCCPRCSYRSKWKWDVVKHLKRCGGGTVKDVIDTTKSKDGESSSSSSSSSKAATIRTILSNGPPNVTVGPSMKLPTKSDDGSAILQPDSCDSESDHADAATPLALLESKIPEITGEADKNGTGQAHYCLQCPFMAHSQAELRRHNRVHSDEKPFICKTCGYCSKWKCDLKKHLRTYNHTSAVPLTYGGHGRKPADWFEDEKGGMGGHSGRSSDEEEYSLQDIGAHACSKCSFVTHSAELLEAHKKTHKQTSGGRFKCKKCSFEADDLSTILQHKLKHNQGEAPSTEEGLSQEATAQPAAKHRRKASKQFRVVHSAVESFESSEDGSGLDEASYLASSYGSQGFPEAETAQDLSCNSRNHKYTCEWCSWSTDSLNLLFHHARVLHTKEMSMQEAEMARDRTESVGSSESEEKTKLSFAESLDLRPINAVDSPTEEPEPVADSPSAISLSSPFISYKRDPAVLKRKRKMKSCPKCDYVTDNMTTLQRHLSKHGNKGKYTCHLCDYSVDRRHILRYHFKNVHANSESDVFPADEAPASPAESPKEAPVPDSLPESTEDMQRDKENAIKFKVCQVEGVDVKVFNRRKKRFGCTKCPFTSKSQGNVLNHMKQHGQNKKFKCTLCDYSQNAQNFVYTHMITAHGVAWSGDGKEEGETAYNGRKSRKAGPKKYYCRKCPFVTLKRKKLIPHQMKHSRKHHCDKCNHSSWTAELLARHMAKSHAE